TVDRELAGGSALGGGARAARTRNQLVSGDAARSQIRIRRCGGSCAAATAGSPAKDGQREDRQAASGFARYRADRVQAIEHNSLFLPKACENTHDLQGPPERGQHDKLVPSGCPFHTRSYRAQVKENLMAC